jgi:hypothetical protein
MPSASCQTVRLYPSILSSPMRGHSVSRASYTRELYSGANFVITGVREPRQHIYAGNARRSPLSCDWKKVVKSEIRLMATSFRTEMAAMRARPTVFTYSLSTLSGISPANQAVHDGSKAALRLHSPALATSAMSNTLSRPISAMFLGIVSFRKRVLCSARALRAKPQFGQKRPRRIGMT